VIVVEYVVPCSMYRFVYAAGMVSSVNSLFYLDIYAGVKSLF